ncbi:putative signal transduction protein [Cellvibrio japonicus Ueda107]|uniref:Putative signal transduction protein n=1 Tax=Cellvibrio japonicus (strain Ueda107) TaxID=498211 RepID=B3PK96_CELJU|nr:putative signal transduction protein [Cellvibrio japonicus Ueda107]QEI11413.1 EAL domain-containing protein [Cellvibrio japonicus]QEI14987.1 EAL domain-containing protein [Cellvibrio japonicus]QEI18567.1 EAL domain-containing protein [Cellvibrio japonicus]
MLGLEPVYVRGLCVSSKPAITGGLASTDESVSERHILILNNDSSALELISNRLKDAGYDRLTLVSTAANALALLRHESVDLLIVDVDTQDLDGWRLSRLVRSGILKCPSNLPIIIVARTWCERIAEVTAREYGINRLVPLEHLDMLPKVVEQLMGHNSGELPRPRLLVVEDQPDTSDLIQRVLAIPFDIEVAADGLDGLEAWKRGRHDLVLLDVMLPRLSGRDILIEIQRIDPQQPIVIMTAHTTVEQAEELMLLGAVDFLPKPFRAEQLRKVCDIAIHREDFLVSNEQFALRVQSLQERERAYRQLYQSHHQLLDDLQTVVMELDDQLAIQFLNRAWEHMMGFAIGESLGRNLDEFIVSDQRAQWTLARERMRRTLLDHEPCADLELCLRDSRGHRLWAQFKVSLSSTGESQPRLTICLDNVTEQRAAQEQLKYLAMHDSLTGLNNRHFFETSLKQLTADALRNHRQHGLVYIDLDHFKVINDSFGHQKGDEVLREVAHLLRRRIRRPDIFCRLGGDEFAVLLHDVSQQQAEEFARDIQQLASEFNFQSQGQRINLGCSIGLTLINNSTERAEEHLMRADIALYVAKGRGRNLIHVYDPEDSESDDLRNRLNISRQVREAINENRILLHFQPIFDVNAGQVAYYEALVRVRTREGTLLAPGQFIPAMESSGDMHLLDRRIIQLALHTLKSYPSLVHIAINLSAQAFKDESLLPAIVDTLKETGITPERVTFELTESASLFNLRTTQRVITELHQLGCSFSVDDFGSGFSSFAYLKDLPADYIKLDGSFIQNLHQDPVDQTLVRSMIQVIQALGKKAVAEYVENAEILSLLKTMGIDFVQGYHIGHPLPVEQVLALHPRLNDSQVSS